MRSLRYLLLGLILVGATGIVGIGCGDDNASADGSTDGHPSDGPHNDGGGGDGGGNNDFVVFVKDLITNKTMDNTEAVDCSMTTFTNQTTDDETVFNSLFPP